MNKSVRLLSLICLFALSVATPLKKPYDYKLKKQKFQEFKNMNEAKLKNENEVTSWRLLSTQELIKKQGYPVRTYHVETEDGYILELHRIPFGRNGKATLGPRPPVYLQHCFLCSSSDWIMNSPDKALAYILADAGYDVWLGNARGNTYSRNHVSLSPDSDDFWEFSWHEMGKYDAPASIDFVLQQTKQEQLHYIGFSMGTTIFFVMANERPEYMEKVKLATLLAPVAQAANLQGPLKVTIPFTNILERSLSWLGMKELFIGGVALDYISDTMCDPTGYTASLCHNILFFFTGSNDEQLNKKYLPEILAHTPAGTSIKTMMHFMQGSNSGQFRQYDYGIVGNLQKHHSISPPSYNLDHITTPVAIFYSENDLFAVPNDVLNIRHQLPNVVKVKKIKNDEFTHLDFIWALDADKYVYRDVLNVLQDYK